MPIKSSRFLRERGGGREGIPTAFIEVASEVTHLSSVGNFVSAICFFLYSSTYCRLGGNGKHCIPV